MKHIFIILLLTVFQQTVSGQDISGYIFESNGDPVIAANIINTRTNEHSHSDVRGYFTISRLSIGDTIIVNSLGFRDYSYIFSKSDSIITIILQSALFNLDEIVVTGINSHAKNISTIDTKVNPVNSSQDILRRVPGLFIGQHAGGGKAEQIFLRGFDIDHGTDIAINVDGMPVNMVSHAHGQGYADLHFLIPETINRIAFDKGPYTADKGNFATAGYVEFETKKQLNENLVKAELGQFNTYRLLGMMKLLDDEKQQGYVASELLSSDGPFESPQNFSRFNAMTKYSKELSPIDQISLTASYFTSRWDASGQVPQRAIDSGLITRFGAIDDTEGGQTSRGNIKLGHQRKFGNGGLLSNDLFYSSYQFDLFSNFTFFLDDPINGDQIRQLENRDIIGASSEYTLPFQFGEADAIWTTGVSLRYDQSIDNQLLKTTGRTATREIIQQGNIFEQNIGVFTELALSYGDFNLRPSIRWDQFDFQYTDILRNRQKSSPIRKGIVSPKLSLAYDATKNIQLYGKLGRGFHSNDTRVVVAQNGREILPAAFGYDLGIAWKPLSRMLINMAYWDLYLEQEFVYVGDAGIVEPSGRTSRQGVDLSLRYQLGNHLFFNTDGTYTYAKALDQEPGNNFIPLAPEVTMVAGVNLFDYHNWGGSLNLRYLGDRPANEDYSIIARGYTVVDASLNYQWRDVNLGIQVQNLLNTEWEEAQFATESRLAEEPDPVEEIHFTPGTPFFMKFLVGFRF